MMSAKVIRQLLRRLSAFESERRPTVLLVNICFQSGGWWAWALLISWKIFLILRAQRATEAQNRKLSTLVEQNPSAIVITDLDGVIEYVNPAFLQISGYHRDEVIGQKINLIKSGVTPDEVYRELWETIEAGEVWFRVGFGTKEKMAACLMKRWLFRRCGMRIGCMINYVSVKLNITEKVRLEEEQRRVHLSMKAIVDNLPLGSGAG